MVNPHLGILGAINPREKGKSMARGSSKAHMAYVRSFRKNPGRKHRRSAAKRNPFPLAGLVVNPHRRRRAKRNPSFLGANSRIAGMFGFPPLQSVLYAGAGLIGTPMLEARLIGFLPASITGNALGKYGVRIATVLALSFVASKTLGREQAKMVALGGGAYVLASAAREFAGVGAYTANLSAYTKQLSAPAWGAQRGGTAVAPDGGMNIVAGRFRRFQ